MQKYEMMVILDTALTDARLKELSSEIKTMLGEVTYESVWGARDLAYRMGKHAKGYYIVWNFQNTQHTNDEIEIFLRLNPGVIRHLLIKIPDGYTPFSLEDLNSGMERLSEAKAAVRARKDGKSSPVKPGQEDKRAERKEILAEVAEEKAAKHAEKEAQRLKEMEGEEGQEEEFIIAKEESTPAPAIMEEPIESPKHVEDEKKEEVDEKTKPTSTEEKPKKEKSEKKDQPMSSSDLDERLNKIFEDDLDLKL